MVGYLNIVNNARMETRNGLKVVQTIYVKDPKAPHLHVGEMFWLTIMVCNALERGAGGPMHGDAHFKNIIAHVEGTEYTRLLDAKVKNAKDYRLSLGPDNTLAEGEWARLRVQFEVMKEAPHSDVETEPAAMEQVAFVRVCADFDIARYFRACVPEDHFYDIQCAHP